MEEEFKDDLKKYVDENRASFEVPGEGLPDLWGGIAAGIDAQEEAGTTELGEVVKGSGRQAKLRSLVGQVPWLRIAAVLIIGVALTTIGIRYTQNSNEPEEQQAYAVVSEELGETDAYYTGLIAERMAVIKASSQEIDPIIWEDLDLLDAAFSELKEDLKDNADNEEVVNAMIKNYRIKLEILEQIIEELQANEPVNNDI